MDAFHLTKKVGANQPFNFCRVVVFFYFLFDGTQSGDGVSWRNTAGQ